MNQTEMHQNPIHEIFEYARTVSAALTSLLSPLSDGTDWLGDDGTDDLRSMNDALDLCSRALCADERYDACELLVRSFLTNDPRILNAEMPITFDPFDNAPYFTWAGYFSSDCPQFCDFPYDED